MGSEEVQVREGACGDCLGKAQFPYINERRSSCIPVMDISYLYYRALDKVIKTGSVPRTRLPCVVSKVR